MGADVPEAMLERLRGIAAGLPDTYEERAWRGVRWMVRKKTFAHTLFVEDGQPPAYARGLGSDGPALVLTFRTSEREYYLDGHAGPQFFWPGWSADLAGVVLGDETDWQEIAELLTESYCICAPKKLRVLVAPGDR